VQAIFGEMTRFTEKASTGNYSLQSLHDDLSRLRSVVLELSTWLVGVAPVKREEEIQRFVSSWVLFVQTLGLSGWDVAQIGAKAEKVARSRPRGRPPDRRLLAVRAYEMKLANPGLTWQGIASKICDCNKSSHDEYCVQAIRQAVMQLQKTMRRYRVMVPRLR
jgi:hypothetical protein